MNMRGHEIRVEALVRERPEVTPALLEAVVAQHAGVPQVRLDLERRTKPSKCRG